MEHLERHLFQMANNNTLFDGMVLFCAVVERQNFSAAAKFLGHSASQVSKEIAALEMRLGSRLLHRTTRTVSLTETGRIYYDHARRLVADAATITDQIHTLGDRPFGELRISVPSIFARACLNALLPDFLASHPDITMNVEVSDRKTDMVAEGIDLVVRIGALPDSDMIAKELFKTRLVTVASPGYLEKHPTPVHPQDLRDHMLIDFSERTIAHEWRFVAASGNTIFVPVKPLLRCNDAEMELTQAVAGIGITRLPELACSDELQNGDLVTILTDYNEPPVGVCVIYPSRKQLPLKTRALIDFMSQYISR